MSTVDGLLWQRWDEIDRLMDELLDLPASERGQHLQARTGEDPALRDLVMRLLGRVDSGDGGDRVSGPSDAVVLGAFARQGETLVSSDLDPGTPVGRYIVIARRGRGGMATVYEARRSDGVYEQRVALKVLRRGLDTDDLIRRFLTERQILSSLTHPNIARLLDGGSLPDGRPYLVMEFVDGEPITAFAESRLLDTPARLDLFLQVASTVHAAHRQLVVHRDIKPSNILVSADGHVRLLDFGIAKLLEGDPGGTDAGIRLLTPEYASPEQLRGGPITTGTDVYQLGLLLRELLTGLPPQAPSSPLTGDLAVIVAQALRADPNERYDSAEAMAGDVRRHLRGRPILAHPESTLYRLRKFAGRHPFVLPAAGLAIAGTVAFIAILAVQNQRIARERDAAEAASRRALATQDFLVDLLRSPDPTGAAATEGTRELTVVDALQRGRSRVEVELRDQPEVRGALLQAMGRTFTGLGRHEIADTILRQALRIHGELYGPEHPLTASVLGAIGTNYRRERNFVVADSFLHAELRIRSAVTGTTEKERARMMSVLSGTRRDLGDVDSSVALAARAVALLQSADSMGTSFTNALGALAYSLRGAKQVDSAETVYRRVLGRQELESPPDRLALSTTHNNLAFLLKTRGELPAAERSYRQAVRLAEETLGGGHPTALMFGSNLAAALEAQGKLDEVDALARAQIAAVEREWPDGHWRVGAAHLARGRFLLRQDRAGDAEAPLRAGVESYLATLGAGHGWTATARADLGLALWRSGKQAEGDRHLDGALATLRAFPGGPNEELRFLLDRLVTGLRDGGNTRQADRYGALLARP